MRGSPRRGTTMTMRRMWTTTLFPLASLLALCAYPGLAPFPGGATALSAQQPTRTASADPRTDAPPGSAVDHPAGGVRVSGDAPRTADEQLVLQATRLEGEVTLDGLIDEPVWATAQVADGFTQFDPDPGAAPAERTEARVVYGDDALWVAIRAFDRAPDSIAAQLTRRDQESYSDEVAVVIDSYFDRRTAFHFQVNALGVKTDLYRFDDTGEDTGWDAVWEVATARDDQGWSAEFRIPYSQLRFRDAPEQRWGINFVRRIARHGEMSVWAPTSREESAIVSRFGELRGMVELSPPRRLEFTPYSLARLERSPGDADNPFYSSNDFLGSVGADMKYGITTDLTLNVTINPDFGQVEADPAQVNLSAYETFLPEQRPFFVEGANLFAFGLGIGDGDGAQESLFYSRRIGRAPQGSPQVSDGWSDADESTTILGAWKLSGKTASGWSVGLLNAVTSEESARIAPDEGERFDQAIEPFTNTAVARIQKDFREGRSAVGVIATATNRSPDVADELQLRTGAYTAGIDARHRFSDENWEVSGYLLGSHLRGSEESIDALQRSPARLFHRPGADHLAYDPTRTSLSGVAATATLNKIAGGHWRFGTGIQARSPGFDANDAGYMRDADFASTFVYLGYDQSSPQGIFRRYRLNFNAWNSFYWSNRERANTGGNVNGNAQFTNFWNAYGGIGINAEGLSSGTLRGGPDFVTERRINWWSGFNSDSRKPIGLNMNLNGHRVPESDGWGIGVSPTLRWRPTGRANISLGGFWNRNVNDRQWVGRHGPTDDPAYLLARLDQTSVGITSRLDLALSPTLSVQLYAQPFASSGSYGEYKRVADPQGDSYADRIQPLDLARSGDDWVGDVDGDGEDDAVRAGDFDIRQFRSNAVLRWEYRPGSTLFVVWAQGRDAFDRGGTFDFSDDFGSLFDQRPSNVFMVKLSYWLTP